MSAVRNRRLAGTLHFPPFRLDLDNACLWRGTKRIVLRPKDFALLHVLMTHAGQLVTHGALLQAVWADVMVSPGVLKVAIRRLRRALGDAADKPRFIENVPWRGYRWIGTVRSRTPSRVRSQKRPGLQTPDSGLRDSLLVGRETELAQLHQWFEKAQSGQRQMVFVTGEPGIGKTTVVEAFLAQVGEENQKAKACPERSRRGKGQKAKIHNLQSAIRNPQLP